MITKKQNIFFLIIIISIILAFAGRFFYKYESDRISEEKYFELSSFADFKADEISNWYKDEINDVSLIANRKDLKNVIEAWTATHNPELKTRLFEMFNELAEEHGYEDIIILDVDGELLFSIKGIDSLREPIIDKAVDSCRVSDNTVCTDLYRCNLHQKVHLDFVTPLLTRDNRLINFMVLRIDPNSFLYPLIRKWPAHSKSAETLLIRKQNDSVVFLNELRHMENSALNLRFPLSRLEIPAVKAVLGNEGITEGVDYRGVDVLSDIRAIKGTNWFMVAKIDKDEIFSELQFRALVITLFTILLILFVAGSIVLIYQAKQKSIYQKLFLNEKKLSEKEEEFKIALYSIGDGLITTDINGIIKQMNPIAEELTGWSEQEARGKYITEVFRIVNEDTRHVVDNPVLKVLADGVIVGLANHTILISKNDVEIPIADSGAPIKDSTGEVIGVVLVFRDQTKERRAQKMLEESEEKNRAIINAVPDLMFILDNKGKILDYIAQNKSLLFLQPENFMQKKLSDVLPSDISQVVSEKITSLFETGEIQTFQYSIVLNGETRYYDDRLVLYGGNKALSIARDITAWKRSENALKESEEIFNHFMEYSPIYIFFKDKEIKSLRLSKNYEKMIGRNIDELLGKSMFDLFPSELAKSMVEDDQRILSEGKVIEVDEELNGHFYTTIKFPIYRNGEPTFLAGFTMDITEKKLAEENVKKLSRGIEQNPASIIIADRNGRIEYINPKFTEITGYSLDDVRGKIARILKPGKLSDDLFADLWETIKSGKVWSGEFLSKKKNGETYWESVSISSVSNEFNEITNYILIIEDITERKEIIQELIEARDDAEKADRLKSEFLAQMSHEIRTPLNTILNYSSLLKEEYSQENSDNLKAVFAGIGNASNRIIRTIDLILNISEIATDAYDYEPKNVDIYSEIIITVCQELKQTALNAGIELRINPLTTETRIYTDEYSVSQIFVNLIDNAIKYTKTGFVEVRIYRNNDNLLCVDIEDSGVGISEEFISELFTPFTQEESGYSRRFEGTGLGLSLVKKYCEINNAEISVRSKKNVGSVFTVVFNTDRIETN